MQSFRDVFNQTIPFCARDQLVDPTAIDGADHGSEFLFIGDFNGAELIVIELSRSPHQKICHLLVYGG